MNTQRLRQRLFARCALATLHTAPGTPHPPAVGVSRLISYEEFITTCTQGAYIPEQSRMSVAEADAFLYSLEAAGEVVVLEAPTTTTEIGKSTKERGKKYISSGITARECCQQEQEQEQCGTTAHNLRIVLDTKPYFEAVQRQLLQPHTLPQGRLLPPSVRAETPSLSPSTQALVRAAQQRRRHWAYVALWGSLQLWILGYCTFIVFSWDVMEPICFFLTSMWGLVAGATALRRTSTAADRRRPCDAEASVGLDARLLQERIGALQQEEEEDAYAMGKKEMEAKQCARSAAHEGRGK